MVLVSLLALLAVAVAQQCVFPAHKPVPLSAFQACVTAVPVDHAIKAKTLAAVNDAMMLYAFRDIVEAPPESPLFHISVDVSQRLQAIAATPVVSDWAFHQAINNVFIDLRDPHTVYRKPSLCYGFAMELPVAISSRLDPALGQVLFLQSAVDPALQPFVGGTILQIDGQDAVQAVRDFAFSSVFISKDPGTAFNYALKLNYVSRTGIVFDFPSSPNTTWLIAKPGAASGSATNVTLAWFAVPSSDLTVTAAACHPAASAAHHQAQLQLEAKQRTVPVHRRAPLSRAEFLKADARPDIVFSNISRSTMLLQISTFEPANTTQFLQTLTDGIAFATLHNISNLLIDLSSNGGGDICLGYTFISNLLSETFPIGAYDMIQSPLAASMANAAAAVHDESSVWSPYLWTTLRSRNFTSSDWYWGQEGEKYFYTRGNRLSQYSSPIEIYCGKQPPRVDASVFTKAIVLTDGLCGSTCSVVASHIGAVNHATTVVYGGFADIAKQQPFSFPGGLVYNIDALVADARTFGISSWPYVPQSLPAGGSVSFAAFEIYPWNRLSDDWRTPLEFVFTAADHVVDMWCFNDPACTQRLYAEVQKIFNTIQ